MSPKLSHRIGEIMQQNEDNGIKNSAVDEPQLFLILCKHKPKQAQAHLFASFIFVFLCISRLFTFSPQKLLRYHHRTYILYAENQEYCTIYVYVYCIYGNIIYESAKPRHRKAYIFSIYIEFSLLREWFFRDFLFTFIRIYCVCLPEKEEHFPKCFCLLLLVHGGTTLYKSYRLEVNKFNVCTRFNNSAHN